jgi:hypothetical protein
MKEGLMRTLFYQLGVIGAAFVGGMVGAIPVFSLGLFVHPIVIWPLTLAIGALFAALSAAWAGILFAPDQTQSHLLAVVGVSQVIAFVIVPIFPLVQGLFPRAIYGLGLSVLILALGASWATWRYRRSRDRLGRDAALTLGLVGLAPLVVIGAVYLASLFGLTSA